MNAKKLLQWIMILAVAGVTVSLYSWLHKSGLASGEFCSVGETLNCDVVNKGPYSQVFGIPVALIGVIGYAFLFFAAFMKTREPNDRQLSSFLLLAALGGLAFSLYLTGIEAFVLETWCMLCLTSQAIILLITAATARVVYLERK